ncbi:uncharacterized protein LOC121726687 [Aricia agestis]|uniref:uncharacterized protein LOC121726687 n=1 Tax=Aricia agestis TaxID=91739 RepID=UPI001C208421|nr:uncharacterized protein LOC121726687 [Aricia agestis]
MPRKPCYWTRKLELELVNFVREREYIWKPTGNTNHHIEQKYRAYAEFAAQLGRGFTARSVRDRWVNIRNTFNHNLRKVDRTTEAAKTPEDIYVPCWPLWKPLQFLREVYKKDTDPNSIPVQPELHYADTTIKDETNTEETELNIRQRVRPKEKPPKQPKLYKNKNKCKQVVDDLVKAMAPLTGQDSYEHERYWFFGRHITEQLNAMRERDAQCASQEILNVLESISNEDT